MRAMKIPSRIYAEKTVSKVSTGTRLDLAE